MLFLSLKRKKKENAIEICTACWLKCHRKLNTLAKEGIFAGMPV
jgi:hypothetical protein